MNVRDGVGECGCGGGGEAGGEDRISEALSLTLFGKKKKLYVLNYFLFREQLLLLESHLEPYCCRKLGTTSDVIQGTAKKWLCSG